jgi:hypothetical protein
MRQSFSCVWDNHIFLPPKSVMAVPHFLNQFASKKERIEAVQFKAVENEYEQFFVRTHKVEQGVSIVLLFWVNSKWGIFGKFY